MRADQLTQDHVGSTIGFTIRNRRHSFTLGHLYREDTQGHGPVILVREQGADPWDAYTLTPDAVVELSQP